MKPYYEDSHVTVYNKSCTDMSELADESVQCCVTSPPYWGLRKYSGEQDLVWGGENHHEHKWDLDKISLLHENRNFHTGTQECVLNSAYALAHTHKTSKLKAGFCSVCGAWRGAFGLEPSPELYVSHLIEILREVKRVLRKDGTLFLNLGDSYASGGKSGEGETRTVSEKLHASPTDPSLNCQRRCPVSPGLKPKDLCLIPFRVALAAQADGWYVRSVIIWSKNNPMPESVFGSRWERHRVAMWPDGTRYKPVKGQSRPKEVQYRECPGCPECAENGGLYLYHGAGRPTESHEYILMLTKSANYYFDQEAVREALTYDDPRTEKGLSRIPYNGKGNPETREFSGGADWLGSNPAGRNLRSVWTFSTQPYPEAHFATFPEELPERCIKAGTPEYGCCDKCGRPYERVVETKPMVIQRSGRADDSGIRTLPSGTMLEPAESKTLGWKQACTCADSKPVPSLVLDPFAGSGTTLWVAKRLNRHAVGYEISAEYCQLIVDRNRQQVLL